MKIKITDDRQEMSVIGRELARRTRANLQDEKYQLIWNEMDLIRKFDDDKEKEDFFYSWLYDFWVYGNNIREEFFYDFAHKSHEEKSKYITFANRFEYYKFLNNPEDEKILKDKYLTYECFKEYYGRDVVLCKDAGDYGVYSKFVKCHPAFIVKPESLALGTGVHIENVKDWHSEEELFESLIQEGLKNSQLTWKKNTGIVLEELIKQDEAMAVLHPASVNIIRIITVWFEDKIEIIDAWLRIGINGNEISGASMGEIYCGVNLDSGIVETKGYTEFADVYEKHPYSHIELMGYQIPRWDELISLCQELARKIPTVRLVGWDLALTENGWVIVEGNENTEFLGQMMYEKPYKQMVNDMIGWSPKEGYWWEKQNPKFV